MTNHLSSPVAITLVILWVREYRRFLFPMSTFLPNLTTLTLSWSPTRRRLVLSAIARIWTHNFCRHKINCQWNYSVEIATPSYLRLLLTKEIYLIIYHDFLALPRRGSHDLIWLPYFFGFLLIEFQCIFPVLIKYYHILFIIIVFCLGCDSLSGLLLHLKRTLEKWVVNI